ncbi:MAG TPA: NUDIX domain-containing protein [Thermomicrobiales bacterium]|nr:NUDIX domain-containing protein [Thermomicrobiales bacterium]
MTNVAPASPITRDFTVAVFVVDQARVLLHWHRKLGRWLPPGGHIEPHELPDEAAVREVHEETGAVVQLRVDYGIDHHAPGEPRQLCRPAGIQLEDIAPGHQHIDLIYFATLAEPSPFFGGIEAGIGWFGPADWDSLNLTQELIAWCRAAIAWQHAPTRS